VRILCKGVSEYIMVLYKEQVCVFSNLCVLQPDTHNNCGLLSKTCVVPHLLITIFFVQFMILMH